MEMIKYPQNIQDYFSDGQDEEFAMWAFGCKQPGSNINMIQFWEKLHPEHPIRDRDSMFICICKMNYLFQQDKLLRQHMTNDEDKYDKGHVGVILV